MRYTTTDGPSKALNAIQDGSLGDKMGNAAQQIDGFFRQMQFFSEAQQADNKKIELLETRLDKISTDDVIIQTMHNDIHALAARLDTAVNRLQGLRFVGSSFKNL